MITFRTASTMAAVLLVAAVASSCSSCRRGAEQADDATGEAMSVSIEVVRQQTIRAAVSGPGIVSPAATGDWTIHAPETGRIASLPQAEGASVEVGDVLVKFEFPTDANAITHETELANANARLAAARAEVAKVTPLFERGYASRSELEAATGAVSSAELEVARLKRLLEAASQEQDRATVRARFNGKIAKVFHREGDLVSGSMLDPVLRVVDPSLVEVAMAVQVQDLGSIQVGMAATVLSINGAEPATVSLRPTPTDPKATTQEIRLTFVNPTTLALDTPVSVEILLAERPNVIAVPTAAVIHDGGDSSYVMVVNEDGHATRREVRTGLTAGERVEIASGLTPGDRVIVRDATNVADGTAVIADK